MKRIISLILIFGYVAAVFQFTTPYLSYVANYSYFSQEACVNKLNPELECNGKCQLKKMVKDQHRQHSDDSNQGLLVNKTSSSSIFFWEFQRFCLPQPEAEILRSKTSFLVPIQLFDRPPTPPPRFV